MYSGGTRQGELDRSAVLFTQILEEQGAYFALMFLLDSGYGREEIAAIAERLEKRGVETLDNALADTYISELDPAIERDSDD